MSLQRKVESAFLEVIRADGSFAGTRLHSLESQKLPRVLPCVLARAASCLEVPTRGSGNFKVRAEIMIFSTADQPTGTTDDPAANHALYVQQILNGPLLSVPSLEQTLTSAGANAGVGAFYVFGTKRLGQVPTEPDERTFVTAWAWEVTCCEAVLS